ncbi:MAG: hypothetical protein F6K24_00390, partial [Okeania sp. SIO2D1]|nr:hypothetical protein [Okeania sp. SIO2D1]
HDIKHGFRNVFGSEKALSYAEMGKVYKDASMIYENKSSHSHSLNINYNGTHSHSLEITSAGSHSHNLNINSKGSHSHNLDINSNGNHSHTISINNSSASLGNPVTSSLEKIRHGNETRTKNLALIYCIKY